MFGQACRAHRWGNAVDSRDQAQFQQMQRAFRGQQVPRSVTAAATVALSDYLVACDATSAGFTLTLPAVKDAKGMSFLVVKTDSSANAVTIDGSGSETINGATTFVLAAQWSGATLYCDGSAWHTRMSVIEATAGAFRQALLDPDGGTSSEPLLRLRDSANTIAFQLDTGALTQTTIGANGTASALTAAPKGYLKATVAGLSVIIPYYNP